MLLRYTWPGNVRELGIVIERAVMLGAEGEIKVEDLRKTPWEDHRETLGEVIPLKSFTEKMERAHIARVLEHTGGQVSEAARILGLSRGTLYRKMEAYRIRKD